nr:unnamed protein product [Digitaria exilis]
MPRGHGGHHHAPHRRGRLLPITAAAAALLLLALLVLLPAAPPAGGAPASLLRAASGDVPAALHLASASLQCQYDCSHLLSLPAFRSHPLTSRFLSSLAPQTLTAAPKPSSSSAATAAFPARIRPDATVCKTNPGAKPCSYSTVQAAVDAAPNYTAGHFELIRLWHSGQTATVVSLVPYYCDGGFYFRECCSGI